MAIVQTAVNVTPSTTELVSAANMKGKKYIRIVNISDTVVDVKIGADAVAAQGLRITANGGVFELNSGTGFGANAVNAIHASTGNKAVSVFSI